MCWKTEKKSEKKPQGNSERTDKTVNWAFAIVALTMAMILMSCAFMFYNSCMTSLSHKECDHRWMELRDSIYDDMSHIDSIFATRIPSGNVKGKELSVQTNDSASDKFIFTMNDIENLKEAQKTLIARQDKLADDLRQETNNMINKVNGWLSFWMGVIAVLGVFVPIALQFKLYRETRDSDLALKKQHDEDRMRIEDCLQESQADIEDTIEHERTNLQHIKKELKHQMESAKFFGNVRSFHNLADCPSLSTNEARDILLRRNWGKIVDNVQTFIRDYLNESDCQQADGYMLSVLLIQVADVLSTLRRLYPHRSRRLQFMMEESYRIITEINAARVDRNGIIASLASYSESLSALAPFSI